MLSKDLYKPIACQWLGFLGRGGESDLQQGWLDFVKENINKIIIRIVHGNNNNNNSADQVAETARIDG